MTPAPSLSTRVLGLDWRSHFPIRLRQEQESIEYCDYEAAADFMRASFGRIYQTDAYASEAPRFLSEDFGEAKRRYYREAGDFFAFRHRERVTGIFVGTLTDWGTYYFRNCSILPEYQGGKRYQQLLAHLIAVLRAQGVERIEGDVAPINLPHIHILNKLGFTITGTNLSERWGALVRFNLILSRPHAEAFHRQFCEGARHEAATPAPVSQSPRDC